MKGNTLTSDEKNLLQHCLQEHAPVLLDKIEILDSGLVEVTIVDEMRGAVGLELASKGYIDNKWSQYGLKLEDLIDRLASLYMWPKEKK